VGGINEGEGGEGTGVKVIKVHICMYVYEESIMKPTKYFLKRWGRERRLKQYNRVNFFKIHCIHSWNFHIETPLYY
jgi:hypothetical protein